MSLAEIEQAQRAARLARARFEGTLDAVQDRLRPANLANEAWVGVKDKSATIAEEAVDAVKQRPGTVSMVLGALALFLARAPLKRAVGGLISRDGSEDGAAALEEEQPVRRRTRRSK